jgi:hypothetical protein
MSKEIYSSDPAGFKEPSSSVETIVASIPAAVAYSCPIGGAPAVKRRHDSSTIGQHV